VILSQQEEVDARMVFQAHSVLAEVALYDGRFEEAGPHLEEALRLQRELHDRVPLDGHLQTVMAWYLDDVGRASDARLLLAQVRKELVKRLGADHPYVIAVDDAMVNSYLSEGNWQDAEQALQSLRILHSGGTGESQDTLAALFMAKGAFQSAEPILDRRYKQVRALPRDDQYRLVVFSLQDQMGRLKFGVRKLAESKTHFESAIQTLSHGNPANPYLAATRARYGLCLLAMGDKGGAIKQAELASRALKTQPALSRRFREPLELLTTRLADASRD
ncbi:MAG TPA: tetratricopeptide repeat protein, partial [Aquabacterium sp.]|uniref:tetratricopeptide repeat protein n=1 Tax=Aquabacterium sp. TaxID=1872578 RepID=UPI002E36E9A1